MPTDPREPDDEFDHWTEERFDAAMRKGEPAYWVEDESLSAEETLARFAALHPQPTTGPRTFSGCPSTRTLTWPSLIGETND